MSDLKFFNALKIGLKDHFHKLWDVIDEYKSFENIYNNLDAVKNKIKLKSDFNFTKCDIDTEFDILIKNNVEIITFWDDHYPKFLKQIYMPPLGLYIVGNIANFNKDNNLAIIGSRKPTNYGKIVTEKLIKELAEYDVNVIAGLARGIDTMAHINAVKNNLKTMAIIGSGYNKLYPSENKNLANTIIQKGGAIVSEYPINFWPEKYYFVARNRIISGVSKAILIVESKKRGGTLITAKFAEEQNRDIFAIPNNIFELNGQGTNQLIKEGAKLIESAEDIIWEMGLNKKEKNGQLTIL